MQRPVKSVILTSSIWTVTPLLMTRMPVRPLPAPSILRWRSTTSSPEAALTVMPLVSDARMLPTIPPPSIVIALVMVTEPNPPGSSTEMTPPVAVFEIAPANVLHGAVRLHGLASSPTPDTQVRVACACAGAASVRADAATASAMMKWRVMLTTPSK